MSNKYGEFWNLNSPYEFHDFFSEFLDQCITKSFEFGSRDVSKISYLGNIKNASPLYGDENIRPRKLSRSA